jgi:hypothetical protein
VKTRYLSTEPKASRKRKAATLATNSFLTIGVTANPKGLEKPEE